MKGKIALATLAMIPMTANNAYASNIGTVTASSLNVRSGPSTSYTVVTTVKKNDKVNILQSSNGWYKIETSSGKQGWVSSSYISASNSNTNNSTNNNTQSNIAIVNTDGLNFRNGAGTSYSIIKVLNKGEKVEVISESNGWSKVKHDSRLGYVASQYIDKATTNYTIKEVNTDGLNVRTGPSTSYATIGKLNKGTRVEVISESAGWSKINYNNKTAYVSSGYLKAVSTSTPDTKPEDTTQQYKEIKVVNTDGLNVRKGPSTSYESIGKIDKGTSVEVISESDGWSKINYKNTTAYVATRYLDKKSTNTEDTTQQYKEIKVVNTDGLNVRKGPSTSYESIGKIDKGTSVEVISESDGWSKINYKNTTAYVATRYLDKISSNEQVPPVVGGESTENVSGATIYYKALNYTLQNHIDAQYKKALEGGNVISSSISRMSEELTTSMPQSRAFVTPSKADLEYYLNPKNFTNSDKGMMQFLRLDTYKGGITESELNSYLNSLPKVNGKNTVFYNQGKAFINAAQKYDIDLVYLVSHAMWETGYGKSVLAQGQTITSYKGKPLDKPVTVYNFFGIGAIDKSANVSGAEASYSNGWTSIEKTIEGS
ncbi:MAG: SH3 domain-containing protein, partial [Peptostreptococcaceae bacterium]|nr:SH3 domain-containing protein [Peptostreptococcaceae bacterium]